MLSTRASTSGQSAFFLCAWAGRVWFVLSVSTELMVTENTVTNTYSASSVPVNGFGLVIWEGNDVL